MGRRGFWIAAAVLPLLSSAAAAQQPVAAAADSVSSRPVITAHRVPARRPDIDGSLNETAWNKGDAVVPFIQLEPDPGGSATERTAVQVLYDSDALYVGIRLYDSNPDSIVARLARRDVLVYSDWVFVEVDGFRAGRFAHVFGLNARGVKWDGMLRDEGEVDDGRDLVWDGAVRIDSLGWTAEFRIPFSQLRFDVADDEQPVWRINVRRHIARREEISNWSPIRPNSARISPFGDLTGLTNLRVPEHVEIRPYVVGRWAGRTASAGTRVSSPGDYSAGADIRYGVSPDLILTGTINPDFGQVEADAAVVNIRAYQTFFPEKRPFFLDGAQIFRFGERDGQLFYSRRIGRAPQGTPATQSGELIRMETATSVLEAAKLTGRAGEWTIGAMHALTGREHATIGDSLGFNSRREIVEPLTNYFVGRVLRDIANRNGGIGAIFTATNRQTEDAPALSRVRSRAYAGGLDAWRRFGPAFEISASLAGSAVHGSAAAIDATQRAPERYFQRPDARHLPYDPTRTVLRGYAGDITARGRAGSQWLWSFGGHARSPGFEVNDLGFQRDADVASQFAFIQHRGSSRTGAIRNWSLGVTERGSWTFGGERTETNVTVDWRALFQSYSGASAAVTLDLPALSTIALRGGPAVTAPGLIHGVVGLHSDRRKRLNVRADGRVSLEQDAGGRLFRVRGGLNFRPSTTFELALEPSMTWEKTGWQHVTQRLVRDTMRYIVGTMDQTVASLVARADLTITPTVSLQAYAQSWVNGREFENFRQLGAPRAASFDTRFPLLQPGVITYDGNARQYQVDFDRDAASDLTFGDPTLNLAQLRANVVFRWEYRRGSTLFLVYSHDTVDDDPLGEGVNVSRDIGRLFRLGDLASRRLDHAFLVKLSYWLSL